MDYRLGFFFNHLGSGTFIDFLSVFISFFYFLVIFWLVWIVLALILDKKNGRYLLLAVLITLIIYFIFNDLVFKQIIAHFYFCERPFITHPDIIPLGQKFTDSSFPSGHMASTVAILTCFVYYYRRAWPLALIFALLMAFARMHNGVHYPSDVLVGILLGIGYGLLAILITNKIKFKVDQKKSQNIQLAIDN